MPWPDGECVGVQRGDGDALDAGMVEGRVNVIAADAAGEGKIEPGTVDGPGVVAVGATLVSGGGGQFGEEGVGAVVGVEVAATDYEGALAGADVAVAGCVEDVPAR